MSDILTHKKVSALAPAAHHLKSQFHQIERGNVSALKYPDQQQQIRIAKVNLISLYMKKREISHQAKA